MKLFGFARRRLSTQIPSTSNGKASVAKSPEAIAAFSRLKEASEKLRIYYPTVQERQNAVKEYGEAIRAVRNMGMRGFKQKDNRPVILQQKARNEALEKKAVEANLPWRIMISV